MSCCENCGIPLNLNANFCKNCRAPQNPQAQPTSQHMPIPPPPNAVGIPEPPKDQAPFNQEALEKILDFIIVNKPKRFGNPEYFTGILTSERLIFAPMTSDMLKEVANISKQQAKGKTRLGNGVSLSTKNPCDGTFLDNGSNKWVLCCSKQFH